jgi:aspartyl-tRNA(Asn)/glutamyl-tRNA(Gln) amidotransferase subunit A
MSLTPLLVDPALARAALDRGEVSVVELTHAALDRAAQLQATIGAFSELTHELALEQAERVQESLRSGAAGSPLTGLPLGVKDVIDVAGVPTRLGTPRAGHRLPSASAKVCSALAAAGAVIIGKTATHELAYGMITSAARNPRDPSRITGGSSGGSAAAVGAGIAGLALGTDTNGSVRSPAAHCGVVGLKPTRTSLSRDGVAQLAWTQDSVGVIAPDVATAASAWEVLRPAAGATAPARGGWRVGVDPQACAQAAPGVRAALAVALEQLAGAGADIIDIELPDLRLAGSASVLAILHEAALAWSDQLQADPGGFGPRVRAALTVGAEVDRRAYLDAKRARVRTCACMSELFERNKLDAVALPTVPVTATPAGRERVTVDGRERSVESLQSVFTALASLTGQPALSLPCGTDEDGLPVGLQLLGRARRENDLLALAAEAEAAIPALPRFV